MNSNTEMRLLGMAVLAAAIILGGCNKSAETTATPETIASSDNIADIDVTTNVKTALLQDSQLKQFEITVSTIKGDVRLIGVLDNQEQIDAAIKLARASTGVHTIHNELSVKK